MTTLVNLPGTTDLVARLRRVILTTDLNCGCQDTLKRALDRFTALEDRRQMRGALAEAREQRDQIIAKLAFLTDLNEITEREPDRTVFEEMAILFDEICGAATEAALAIRASAPFRRSTR